MELSIFKGYAGTQPQTATLQDVARLIRQDEALRHLTLAYRQSGERKLKASAPVFAVACRFEGGKQLRHATCLTGLSLVDLDHLPEDLIEPLRMKINRDPHTLLSYRTVSGRGLRILFRYEIPAELQKDAPTSTAAQTLYKQVFLTGNAYYALLLGAETDGQCKNLSRLSGLAHDPAVYLNPHAQPFSPDWVRNQWKERLEQQRSERKTQREQTRIETLFRQIVVKELETENAVFEPGRRNDYVMRVGYKLNQFGVPLESALRWGAEKLGAHQGWEQVLRSCYQRTQEHGRRKAELSSKASRKGGDYASIEELKGMLKERVELRHNELTGRVEYRLLTSDGKPFRPVTDRMVNSLYVELSHTVRVNILDLYRLIESDYSTPFHPLRAYLESLPAWDGRTDYLAELAGTVQVKGGEEEQERFLLYLRKWLTGMVAAWTDEEVVNNVILVFIGAQGTFKTTWFNYLLPPPIRQYFYTKTNARSMGRDELLILAQYALVCCEELDTLRPQELNQLKAAVTMGHVDERAAYARFHEHRKHIASFCGTGNNLQFLTDPTGNRRWLPFEIDRIQSPRTHRFPYEGIYAQAYTLYKEGFQYWFSLDEIQILNQHNRKFEAPRMEQELVQLYFRLPNEEEHGEFMTASRAMQIMGQGVAQKLSAGYIGRAFKELGFKRTCYKHIYGYLVVQRTGEEIRELQKTMAVQSEST